MISIFKFIKDNVQLIAGALMVLFFCLWLQQKSVTNDYKEQVKVSQHIAQQNIDALKDHSIQLQVTRDQLSKIDTNLAIALKKVDSLSHIKSTVITTVKPEYVGKDVIIPNTVVLDTPNHMYGLKFNSSDQVRSVAGISWFKVDTNKRAIFISPGNTDFNHFDLNFTLVISQYQDSVAKYTRTKIVPFHVNNDGTLGNPISDSLLKISYRNAEILDKPFTLPAAPDETKHKRKLQTGWGFSLNPVGVGINNGKAILTPNISFGYYITLR